MANQNYGSTKWLLTESSHGEGPKGRKFLKRAWSKTARRQGRKIDCTQDDTPEFMVDPEWCSAWARGGEAYSITGGATIETLMWPASGSGFYYETRTYGPSGYEYAEGYLR